MTDRKEVAVTYFRPPQKKKTFLPNRQFMSVYFITSKYYLNHKGEIHTSNTLPQLTGKGR